VARTGPLARVTIVALVGSSLALSLATAALIFLNWQTPTPRGMSMGGKPVELIFALGILEMPLLGALIALRRQHRVGWIFLGVGASAAFLLFCMQYGLYGEITSPGAVPGSRPMSWLTSWIWAPMSALIPALFLVFPTGRLPSPRWRLVFVAGVVGAGMQAVVDALSFPGASGFPGPSPISFALDRAALDPVYLLGTAIFSAAILASAGSLIARSRAARGEERQQLKWFAFASAGAAVAFTVSTPLYTHPELGPIASALAVVAFLGIPTAAGLAILRYRLYDVDVIVNRALVYAGVSAVLGVTYVAGVILFQALFRPFALVESELSIAGSTLVVAAVFQPIRRRIQDLVDRRFYRSRYDASRTLDAFTARLRGDVDLDSVRADLASVLHETVRPTHASVWLRGLRQ
jgi:hypothetical protein